ASSDRAATSTSIAEPAESLRTRERRLRRARNARPSASPLALMAVLGYTSRVISSNEGDCTAVLYPYHLYPLTGAELDKIGSLFPAGARILEIGAGTGKQALELQRRGFEVTAVEIADSNYAAHRVFPIKDYDGRTIPLADASVDVVFSSNVLEHVADLSC